MKLNYSVIDKNNRGPTSMDVQIGNFVQKAAVVPTMRQTMNTLNNSAVKRHINPRKYTTARRTENLRTLISVGVKELASAIVVLLSIRVRRIIGAFIASLMDENIVRLWLKEQRDAVEKLAQEQAAPFQTQIEPLRAELQVATRVLQGRPGVEEYSTLLNTLVDQRLRIIGFNLEGAAVEWFRWMTQNGLITDWPRFEESVKNQFGPSKYEDPQGALSKLLQTMTVAEYQGEFEKLMNRVTDISETLLISFYISGLKLPLQRELLVLKPTILGDAFALACVTEARLED
ncbi:ty3-gypsy retrotransposon protein [Tanacetum coccineum]